MYPVSVYLARRPPETVKVYRRGLQLFADHVKVSLDNLHEYIESPKEKLIVDILTFGDSLKHYNQNSQRLYVSAVMAYLSYNEIIIPKAQRLHVVPKKGDLFRDKAMTLDEVRKIYEYLPPVGRAALLLLFSTGMRINECVQIKESDIEGQIIHLSGKYCKGGHGRDVVMSSECMAFIRDIWLPQKVDYLATAVRRNIGLQGQKKVPQRSAGEKSATDDRIIPMTKSTLYEILMRGFNRAGFDAKKGKNFFYHPHGLRKSFRSIIGSQNPDLAEVLMGHQGYLTSNYVRLDIVKEYQKIEHLLSLSGNEGMSKRLRNLEEENKELKAKLEQLKPLESDANFQALLTRMDLLENQLKIAYGNAAKDAEKANEQDGQDWEAQRQGKTRYVKKK